MNSKQLEYVVKLAEVGSFSQLAEQLNITQPALSKQILSLEKELGVQLFDRSTSPISLTAGGEYFVKKAKELLFSQDELAHSMEQFKSGERGRVTIGTTPFRSAYLLPKIAKQVREKYPSIQIRLIERPIDRLRRDAADGCFDFAILNLPADESLLDITPIEKDRLALVVHNELAKKLNFDTAMDNVSLCDCSSLPFVVLGANQEMRILFEKLCVESSVSPTIAAEVVSLTTAWEMACAGVGATLLPLQFINSKREFSNHSITVIELCGDAFLRQPAVAVKKGQYLTEYAKYAILLLTNGK